MTDINKNNFKKKVINQDIGSVSDKKIIQNKKDVKSSIPGGGPPPLFYFKKKYQHPLAILLL